jgi:hypothetical protein
VQILKQANLSERFFACRTGGLGGQVRKKLV